MEYKFFLSWKLCHCVQILFVFLCVKGRLFIVLEFWKFQHGIKANPGYLKVKYAEGKEFVIAEAFPAEWRFSQEEFEGISLYSFVLLLLNSELVLNT